MNTSGCINYSTTTIQSILKISFAGRRSYISSSFLQQGLYGDYWLSSSSGTYSSTVGFDSTTVNQNNNVHYRAGGLPVRCIKN